MINTVLTKVILSYLLTLVVHIGVHLGQLLALVGVDLVWLHTCHAALLLQACLASNLFHRSGRLRLLRPVVQLHLYNLVINVRNVEFNVLGHLVGHTIHVRTEGCQVGLVLAGVAIPEV